MMARRFKSHYYHPSNEHRGSPGGYQVFRVACGGWYMAIACTARLNLVTCKRCTKAA